jgi:hypothetical protein
MSHVYLNGNEFPRSRDGVTGVVTTEKPEEEDDEEPEMGVEKEELEKGDERQGKEVGGSKERAWVRKTIETMQGFEAIRRRRYRRSRWREAVKKKKKTQGAERKWTDMGFAWP